MTLQDFIISAQWVFLAYFISLNLGYLMLNLVAMSALRRYLAERSITSLPAVYSSFELPISILLPAYNEASVISQSVRALLQLEYPEFEIVVINDGSTDKTMQLLIDEFSLKYFPEAYRARLPTAPIRGVYRSTVYPNLRVIDKKNGGGKSDAINAGINDARYPLFCVIDADSILQRDSLTRVVQPFLEDKTTVAVGGTVRIANGCTVNDGFIEKVDLPQNALALFQIVEYLRAFLFGRLGWASLNALMNISGAFGLFRKEVVIAVGGFNTDTWGEDMELTLRLHRYLREKGQPYRITFVADPICWTEAPEDLRGLANQRIRWQRGLAESLVMNYKLMTSGRGGVVGWFAFPFHVIFEFLGPVVEITGLAFIIIAYWFGWLSLESFAAFMLVAIGMGILLSTSALVFEAMSFRVYPRLFQSFRLFLMSIAENLGYRQLNSIWRIIGMIGWAFGTQPTWGEMRASSKLGKKARSV